MVWIILAALLFFISTYTVLWIEQPSSITEVALAKYCLQDLKHQFIKETIAVVSTALYFAEEAINAIEERLPSNPAVRASFYALKPQLRYFIVLEITRATLSAFYLKDRCGNIGYWILCGNASLTSIDAGGNDWWVSPGYFATNIKKCDWNNIITVNETQATLCFDCAHVYAATYIEKKLIYVSQIKGLYNVSATNITDIIIPSIVKKRLEKYS